jgi:menaquinone-dependent protoporphyrinogen IX oxidase
MNIGIVVYSQTGNTRSVAAKLQEALSAAGQRASLEEVKLAGERAQGTRTFQLAPLPSLAGYDALVFGSSVEAFSLSPVMVAALAAVPTLERKRVACLVTQAFPYRWLGGNRAARQMRKLCEAKGARVLGSDVVNWMGAGREDRMARAVARLSKLLQST